MRGLDTNVLVRVMTDDDPSQSAAARNLFVVAEETGERFFVSTVVLCELIWVLGRGYSYDRAELTRALDKILGTQLLEIQDRDVVLRALGEYRRGRADFSDYLLGQLNRRAGCVDTVTFDGKLAEEEGFSELPS